MILKRKRFCLLLLSLSMVPVATAFDLVAYQKGYIAGKNSCTPSSSGGSSTDTKDPVVEALRALSRSQNSGGGSSSDRTINELRRLLSEQEGLRNLDLDRYQQDRVLDQIEKSANDSVLEF